MNIKSAFSGMFLSSTKQRHFQGISDVKDFVRVRFWQPTS